MIERLAAVPERHPGRTLAAIGLLFALAYGTSLVFFPKGRVVVGDAVHYYVYLRSAVFDGDLQFQNDYMGLYGITEKTDGTAWIFDPLPTGYIRNLMPIGPAIVWAPLYLLVTGALAVLRWCGLDYTLDGFGRVFQASAGFSGIIAATLGAWLAYGAALQLFSRRNAILATLAIWLGASPLYYSVVSPTYSHAISMLANGAVVLYWIGTRDESGLRRFAWLGTLIGFAALVRWQEATLFALPVIDALWLAQRVGSLPGVPSRVTAFRDCALRISAASVGAVLVFLPQVLVWQILYGRPFLIPQGGQFMRWTDAALGAVLFSDWHGLFTWTPIVALSVIGLFPLWRRDRHVATGVIVVLAAAWYTNAAAADWWAGEAFGARRFVSCVPLFVIGFAAFADRWTSLRALVYIGAVAIVLNGLLLFQYQMFLKGWRDLSPYPRGAFGLACARFVVPLRMLGHWLGY